MLSRPTPEKIARVLLLIVAVFFTVASAFALLIAVTLAFPGTPLDGVWAMKPAGRAGFLSLGIVAILLMILLAAVLCFCAIGLYRLRPWARWVAFALLAINVIPDAVQGFTGQPTIFLPISIVAIIAVYLALPVTGRAIRKVGPRGE
ncbi:MAG TPA: hypothetical protein VHZ81_15220 [Galbitalea sp.]|jgi:hypothetical protein|nr:hypothetical protein [Galbitalea sp.]